ncbi:c-type cytochrome [Umboniibacter marinipuniceus]|uniref:Cytochrome c553 n=1 Tax=Umboniibacter marinipuniceus TaxID=569599 RepID=A0A3M0AHE1_9GAMM|nr:c-type cytochrome [Umboniibacter marinipuniceus]RMA82178.1 cytochrome c553 [Umboniibacter marinipuniceus]
MNKLFKGMLLSLGLVAMSPAMAAGDASAGESKSAVCAACHGADGNSVNPAWPKIAGQGEKYLLKQLRDVKSGERNIPEMTGIVANMTDQDFQDLAAYYAAGTMQLSGASADDAELLAEGEALFRGGDLERGVAACIGCHSPTGLGNAPAGFPRLSGQHADYVATQLHAFRTGADDPTNSSARTNDGDSRIMRDVAGMLSDRQIRALANYIAGVN